MMYVYASSDQSDAFFHGNSPTAFRVKLPRRLHMSPARQWSLAILDIDLPELTDGYKPSFITVNTNICETSFINCSQAPILQRLYYNQLVTNKPHIFDHLRYIPITADTLESLSIYLVDSSGARPSFKDGHSSCTLHIEKSE